MKGELKETINMWKRAPLKIKIKTLVWVWLCYASYFKYRVEYLKNL